MTAYFSRRYQLSASHRLFCAELSGEENAARFGKCANPHGHGHNYQVEVTVCGSVDRTTGMVCDLVALDSLVASAILSEYDHTNLNLHADFRDLVPSTENFCIAVYQRLAAVVTTTQLAQVRIEETSKNAFVYAGPDAAPLAVRHLPGAKERLSRQHSGETKREETRG